MENEINMSVSQIFKQKTGEGKIYVEFRKGEALAEGELTLLPPAAPKDKPAPKPLKAAKGIVGLQNFPLKKKKLPDAPQAASEKSTAKRFSGKLIRSKGFTKEEEASLEEYIKNHGEDILKLSKDVNVMRAFLGL